jgi:hypothetical protein
MIDKIKEFLNGITGNKINVGESGQTGGYVSLEGFHWYIDDTENGELLFLEDELENRHQYINLDYVENLDADDFLGEMTFAMENGHMVKIWC